MKEAVISPNRKYRTPTVILTTGLAGIALSGCINNGYESNSAFREVASPAARYGFDYSGSLPTRVKEGDYGNSCLDNSPYRSNQVVVTAEGENEVVVTPASKVLLLPLRLTGLTDFNAPLQPVDEYTAKVLESYGCDTQPDGDLKPWGS